MRKRTKIIAAMYLMICLVIVGIFVADPMKGWFILGFFLGEWSDGEIRYTVTSTADDRPIIVFDQMSIDYRRHPFVVISAQEIFPSRSEESRAIWTIQEDPHLWSKQIFSLTYGKCPRGFIQTLAPEPLLTGHFYRVASQVIKKNGPCQYEVIPYDKYLAGVKEGKLQDARRSAR